MDRIEQATAQKRWRHRLVWLGTLALTGWLASTILPSASSKQRPSRVAKEDVRQPAQRDLTEPMAAMALASVQAPLAPSHRRVEEVAVDQPVAQLGAVRTGALPLPDTDSAEAPATAFSSPEEELQSLSERLRGERWTLGNRQQAVERMGRVLDEAARLEPDLRRRLEKRRTLLKEKLRAQTQRVAQLDQRIGELKRN